jgi:hypothetical protein
MTKTDIIEVLHDLNDELVANPLLEYLSVLTIINNKITREKKKALETKEISNDLINKVVSLYTNITTYLSGNDTIIKLINSQDMQNVYDQCKIKNFDDLNDKIYFIQNTNVTLSEINNVYDCMEKTFIALQNLVELHTHNSQNNSDVNHIINEIHNSLQKIVKFGNDVHTNNKSTEESLKRVQDSNYPLYDRVNNMKAIKGASDIVMRIKTDAEKEILTIQSKIANAKILSEQARKFAEKVKSRDSNSAYALNADKKATEIEQQLKNCETYLSNGQSTVATIEQKSKEIYTHTIEAQKVIDDVYNRLGINADYEQLYGQNFTITQLIDRLNQNIKMLGDREISMITILIKQLFEYLRAKHDFKYNGTGGSLTGLFGTSGIGADTDFKLNELKDYMADVSKPIIKNKDEKLKILCMYMEILVNISIYINAHFASSVVTGSEKNVFAVLTKDFYTKTQLIKSLGNIYNNEPYEEAIKEGSGLNFFIKDVSGVINLAGGNFTDDLYLNKYKKYKTKYIKLKINKIQL